MVSTPFAAGDMLNSRYKVKKLIDAGGEAFIHLAEDVRTGGSVVVRQYQRADQEARMRWERECNIRIRSRYVIRYIEGGEANGVLYIVVEYFDGRNLEKLLEEAGAFVSDDATKGIVRRIACGLADIHDWGWVHRDLKPANVLVNDRDELKIIDLGLVHSPFKQSIADDGMARGTLHFMSPEQLTAPKVVDHRSDLYSLGVIVYQMTTGTLPFDGAGVVDVQRKILSETPLAPRVLRPDLDGTLEGGIRRLLARDPRARFQSAQAFLLHLDGKDAVDWCPACTAPLEDRTPFCSRCGIDLRAGKSAPAMICAHTSHGRRWIAVPADGVTLGRELIDPGDGALSREHARISYEGGRWYLEDCRSTNGTRVDAQRVCDKVPLSNGSFVQLADVTGLFWTK
jgi:serine/threonine protein kinase